MTEEEVMKEAEEWLKEMQERLAANQRCKALAKQLRAGELDGLKPFWHLYQQDIDFSKQKNPLDEKYLLNGYSIVIVKNIKKMLDSFYSNQGSFITDKKITTGNHGHHQLPAVRFK